MLTNLPVDGQEAILEQGWMVELSPIQSQTLHNTRNAVVAAKVMAWMIKMSKEQDTQNNPSPKEEPTSGNSSPEVHVKEDSLGRTDLTVLDPSTEDEAEPNPIRIGIAEKAASP